MGIKSLKKIQREPFDKIFVATLQKLLRMGGGGELLIVDRVASLGWHGQKSFEESTPKLFFLKKMACHTKPVPE